MVTLRCVCVRPRERQPASPLREYMWCHHSTFKLLRQHHPPWPRPPTPLRQTSMTTGTSLVLPCRRTTTTVPRARNKSPRRLTTLRATLSTLCTLVCYVHDIAKTMRSASLVLHRPVALHAHCSGCRVSVCACRALVKLHPLSLLSSLMLPGWACLSWSSSCCSPCSSPQ
jgi:hypothetical protein